VNKGSSTSPNPALLFVTLLRTEIPGDEAVRLAVLMALVVVAMSSLAWAIASLLRLSGPQRSGFMLASAFMNSGNFGLPATRLAFGDLGFQYAVIGFLTQSFLSQTFAVYVVSAGGESRREALVQISRMPISTPRLPPSSCVCLGCNSTRQMGWSPSACFEGYSS
jgi:predicted permease